MRFRQYIPVKAGGSSPDPSVYCPANGYEIPPNPAVFCPTNEYYDPDDPDSPVIWYPIKDADGWILAASFQTNSPSTTNFDPSITGMTSPVAWDLGDGTILIGNYWSLSHKYLTTALRTVKLYYISQQPSTIDWSNDNIVGVLDLSSDFFSIISSIRFASNAELTSLLLPSSITAQVNYVYIYSTGIEGILDFSMVTILSTTADIRFNSNPSMTGLTFASSITGTISILYIYSTGITGILDLSMFTTWNAATGKLSLYSNPYLTGVTFPASTITGIIKILRIYSCTSLGYIDLTSLNTGIINLSWDFKNNGWSAAIVNHVLADIDSISAGGYTGRVINIGGTNTDPDASSGGYDGLAAKASLEAKGFTVTTS